MIDQLYRRAEAIKFLRRYFRRISKRSLEYYLAKIRPVRVHKRLYLYPELSLKALVHYIKQHKRR